MTKRDVLILKSPRRRGQVPWMLTVSPMTWLPGSPWRLGICEETHKGMTEMAHFQYPTHEEAVMTARWLELQANGEVERCPHGCIRGMVASGDYGAVMADPCPIHGRTTEGAESDH